MGTTWREFTNDLPLQVTLAGTGALVGAILYVITQMVRTIVPLRVIGILSIVFFIAYGVMAGAVATFWPPPC